MKLSGSVIRAGTYRVYGLRVFGDLEPNSEVWDTSSIRPKSMNPKARNPEAKIPKAHVETEESCRIAATVPATERLRKERSISTGCSSPCLCFGAAVRTTLPATAATQLSLPTLTINMTDDASCLSAVA